MEYCSPSSTHKNQKFCYSKTSLNTIINAWNELNPSNKIIINDDNKDDINIMYKTIEEFMKKKYKLKSNDFWAWTSIIKQEANKNSNSRIYNQMRVIEEKDLRPSQPIEWVKNPTEWLSNFDIEKVLHQYEIIPEYEYKFLGVFPIDFATRNKNNECVISSKCKIDIKELIQNDKIKFLGFITNLSKANEPGTHWTSSFFVLDPTLKAFGGYYYDSTTGRIPKYLIPVFTDIKKQVEELFKKEFKVFVNNIKHQYSNTECGVFSITFQTRWLIMLKKDKDTVFSEVIKYKDYNDETMKKLRNKFFRPNFNHLKKSLMI